jgi:phosphoglycolate phosphatase
MKNRFDLIIFDWDGTLVDSIDWIVFSILQAAEKYHQRIPNASEIKDIIGLSIENAMETLFPETDHIGRELLTAHYAHTFLSKQISRQDLFPGVYSMLQQLRDAGYSLAVATGKKSHGLHAAIQATGLSGMFGSTRSSDQTASKPDPLMIEEIIQELNADKQRTVMVGDSAHDMQMAVNAGVAGIAVTCGAHNAVTLQQYQPLLCLNYATDLLDFL